MFYICKYLIEKSVNMKKIYILIWIMLFSVFPIKASGDTYEFVVWTHSGGQIGYSLDEYPKVTQEAENIIVSTIKTRVEYSVDDVRKFTLNKVDDSGVEEIEISIPMMKWDGEILRFTGCHPGSEIKLLSITGVPLYSSFADEAGSVDIETESLSSGIYLVVTPSITYKIIKR